MGKKALKKELEGLDLLIKQLKRLVHDYPEIKLYQKTLSALQSERAALALSIQRKY